MLNKISLKSLLIASLLFISSINAKAQGPYSIPYVENFTTGSNDWIMPTGSGNYFRWYVDQGVGGSGGLRMKAPDAVNFVVSPLISLSAGKTYTFSFSAKMNTSTVPRRQRVLYNTTNNFATATQFFDGAMPNSGYTAFPFQEFNPAFSVPVSGNYYFFYQAYDISYVNNYFDNVRIEETVYPTVTLTSPLTNTSMNENYTDSTKVLLTATAADADGSISKVQFYNGTTLLGEDLTAPYELLLKDVLPNIFPYAYTAKAFDNRSNATSSAPSNFTVNFRDGTINKYLQWDFNIDNPYGAGLDYWTLFPRSGNNTEYTIKAGFHGTQCLENNNVSSSNNFAASPTVNLKAGTNYNFEFVFHSRGGASTYRFLLATSPNLNDTIALIDTAKIYGTASLYNIVKTKAFTVPTDAVYHVIMYYKTAVATSNLKCQFDNFRIIGSNFNVGPIAELTKPVTAITIAENSNMILAASYADIDGTVQRMEYFANGTKVAESFAPPFEATWSNIPVGVYDIQAKPFDNSGNYGLSVKVTVTTAANMFKASGLIGSSINDTARATVIKENNEIVIAANMGSSFSPAGAVKYYVNGATDASLGAIIILKSDGKTVKSITRVAARVADMSKDQNDFLYIACASGGVIKLNPTADAMIWQKPYANVVHRIDAGVSGKSVILTSTSTNLDAGTMTGVGTYLLDKDGTQLASFGGISQYGADVAIDEATGTVVAVGFKNFNTNDATGGSTYPVYVPVLRGFDFAGAPKYVGYNWSSDPASPSWLNLANNNMADARLNRCAIGKDGKLYIAGQLYGGNHIFRYLPFDNTGLAPLAGGDTYHNLANTGTESHIYFGKFDVATGNVINQQTITARLSSTAGNSMFIEQGGIDADKAGNVYVTGSSAFGMPMSVDYQPGEYTGGAFLMQFNSSLARTNSVRLASDGMGRSVYAKENNQYAYVGTVNNGVIYTTAPHFQPASAGSREGFIGLVNNNNCTLLSNQTSLASANYSANNLVAANLFYDAACKPVVKVVPTNTTATAYFADTAAVKMWLEPTTTTFVKRHFEITPIDNLGNIKPDAATKTARVTLYFTQAEFDEYNSLVVTKLPVSSSDATGIANVRVEKFAGMSNNTTGLPNTYTNGSVVLDPIDSDIIWNTTDARWEVSIDVTGFSGFFVKAPQAPLPLTLLSFTGKRNALNNELNWITENEIAVKNYTVEKSIDAINFKAKATVAALNILQKYQYDYTDVNATDNISYYRLKILNQNNSTSYSNIIKLTNNKIDFSIFPNPTTSSITFNSKQKQTVLVTDVMGRKIKTIPLAEGVTTILLEDLKPGIYFIKDALGNTVKLIKE